MFESLKLPFKLVLVVILCMSSGLASAWNPFGPNNYEDCVLDGVKNAKSDQAANAVVWACRNKFPDTKPSPTVTYDRPALVTFSALGMHRPALNRLIANIQFNQASVVQNYGYRLAVEVTNRNEFSIGAIEISLPVKGGKCSWDDKDYIEMYQCAGSANAMGSGVFLCEIPRIENRRVNTCLTGFGFMANEAQVSAFKSKYGIPSRP